MLEKIFFIQVLLLLSISILSQTRAEGPWWPHSQWGAHDQAGASNWVTPEKVLTAVSLVRSGKIYELGHMYEHQMPLIGNRSYKMTIPSFPTYGPDGEQRIVYNDEFLCAEIGQVGTQFDGPGHVGRQIQMADGSTTEVFYNGFTSEELKGPYGLEKLGVENVRPYITRGILLDVAGYKQVDILPDDYEISMEDIDGALQRQGMSSADIQPGDALLFNVGRWRMWPQPEVLQSTPYISEEVVKWIINRQPSMIGSDVTLDGHHRAVHLKITMEEGIWNLEWMKFDGLLEDQVYEFMFVYAPLRLKGATGSPGRPIAVR